MNQISTGDRSPNVRGNNNQVSTGDNSPNRQNNNIKIKYAIGGGIVGFLLGIAASIIANLITTV